MLTLASPTLTVALDPSYGAEIRVIAGADGHNLLAAYDWEAPIPAARSASYGSSLLDWTSAYRGGWQELFPNAGHECVVDGVPLPFHGEVSVSAWDVLAQDETSATLRVGARLPLVLERRMTLDPAAPVLRIEERATNVGAAPVSFLWGHHPAFAAVAGQRVDLPPGPVFVGREDERPAGAWPRLDDGEDVSLIGDEPLERLLSLPDRPAGWAALRDPGAGRGLALAWDLDTFPHVWIWNEIGGPGFPYFGRACSVGIEPQSSWPIESLAAARERGRCHTLAPGEQRETWLTVALFGADERPVEGVDRDGRVSRTE